MFELFQPTHLLFVFLVALVVLGPKRLMGMSREVGRTIQRFQEYKEEIKEGLLAAPPAEEEPAEKRTPAVGAPDPLVGAPLTSPRCSCSGAAGTPPPGALRRAVTGSADPVRCP